MKKKLTALILMLIMAITQLPASPLRAMGSAGDNKNPFSNEDSIRRQSIETSVGPSASYLKAFGGRAEAQSKASTSYIVKFKDIVSLDDIYNSISGYKYKLLGYSEDRLFSIDTDNSQKFEDTNRDLIEYMTPDKVRKLSAAPNDPLYGEQWAIPDIRLPQAWDVTKGSSTIKVAVIDSGFYRGHEDFNSSAILNGYDMVLSQAGVTSDPIGHGTAVTSILAAAANNSIGISGACWNITIIPYKVCDSNGEITTSSLVSAIRMAADSGADVINLSLGGYDYDQAEKDAIDYALSKGSIVVAASGNEGEPDNPDRGKYAYPASYNGVISVASVNRSNVRSSFSQFNNQVDAAAPGEEILVVMAGSSNSYGVGDGTSFSAPYVSAAAALARSVEKDINSVYFEELLKRTSTDLGTPLKDDYYGWGLVNTKDIVDAARYPMVLGVENNGVYTSSRAIVFNKGTATLNGMEFTSGSTISANGSYTLVVTDTAGNTTTVNFSIVKYVDSVSLSKSKLYLPIDGSEVLNALITPDNATNKNLSWASSSPEVASVDQSGKVTGVSSGTAVITVTTEDGGKTASCTATVKEYLILPAGGSTLKINYETGRISGIKPGTSIADLTASLDPGKGTLRVQDASGAQITEGSAGTGMRIQLIDGSGQTVDELIVALYGDVNGDGNISITDAIAVKSHILGKSQLTGVYAEAADTSGDSNISITDYIQFKAHILGKQDITVR